MMRFCIFLSLILSTPHVLKAAAPAAQIVWDFESGITNPWGAQYNTYKRAPSWARTYLDPQNPFFGKGHSLRVTAHREVEGYCGVWLDFRQASDAPLDASAFRFLSFWAKGEKGGEDFELSLTDVPTAGQEGRPARPLRAYMPGGLSTSWRQVIIPLADFRGLDSHRLLRVTLNLTGRGDSRFYLDSIGFQKAAAPDRASKKPGAAAMAALAADAPRAMWAWNIKPIFDPVHSQEADRFLAFCSAQKVSIVYLAAEFDKAPDASGSGRRLRNPEGYRVFLKRAHQQGLTVEALAGTPEWALRANHPDALAALDAIIEYNQASNPAERFQGVHFDVEPYLLVGFTDPAFRSEILLGLVEKTEKCRDRAHTAGMTFSCDLPSWFFVPPGPERDKLIVDFKGLEKTAGEHLADLVDSVTIMDYTNQADGAGGIIARALPALEYAASRNMKIVIGVETFAERDSTVTFVLGLPEGEFWRRLARSGLRGQLFFEDFRLSLISDGVNVHIGLSTPLEMSPEERAAFEGALARLAGQFGASSDPERYHPSEMLDTARAGLADNPDWKGFEPWESPEPVTGRPIQCFRSTYRMQPGITFHSLGRETFVEEIGSTVEWLGRHPAFGGIAVHFYESFRELMEGPEEEQIKGQMAKGKGQK